GGTMRRGGQLRAFLVLGQTAAAMVLLVGAGLLVKSFWRLVSVDPGFRPDHVLVASLDIPTERYEATDKRNAYRYELIRRVSELPGVVAVGASKQQPLHGGGEPFPFTIPGRSGDDALMQPASGTLIVSPDYFKALKIPLLRGRVFDPHDDLLESPAVLVINQAAAKRYWPNADPMGQTVRLQDMVFTVIGVVGDVRNEGLAQPPAPAVYVPFSIAPRPTTQFYIRTNGDPARLTAAVRDAIHGVDPLQPIADVRPLATQMADTVAQPRFFTILLSIFGSVAAFLAALGLYGVVAYSVARRTNEIGIRMALGARARDVVAMVVRNSAWFTLGGIAAGAAGALVLSRWMSSMLFQVRPADPATFLGAAFLLAGVALVASFIPARRAAGIDPNLALRAD
ncbi:MAG: ABC transporter permease, partial [Gemmatimonadetes bacterium]|nr:ABC transporter permease [Gemmatimonadota bacterium]